MAIKQYPWADGAPLEDHTRRKHKILREYFHRYLSVRCQKPQQTKFRLAVIDGFAGAGRYECGSPGSPIISIEELRAALDIVNLQRREQDLPIVEVECLLIFNDDDAEAIALLKENCAPLLAAINEETPALHLAAHFFADEFERSYPKIAQMVSDGRYRSVFFNLDQYGYSQISISTLANIMRMTNSAEIFLTYAIQPLLAFLVKNNPAKLVGQLKHLGLTRADVSSIEGLMGHNGFLGAAEKLVFDQFAQCAQFVSPFSIHNPGGWRYWLIHFSNNYRARQVYNNILHDNATEQAHFGRSGLDMLKYDPADEGALYLFDTDGRAAARAQLLEDIPRLVTAFGDALSVGEFYADIYNATPAHADDIHSAIIDCDDLEVSTSTGGYRRKANTIEIGDTIRLKAQRTFFPIFLDGKNFK